jgi:hypothetical protein
LNLRAKLQKQERAVKPEQLIAVALKEYDALRKGIDDRADVTKIYGWPVVLLAFGALAGLKTDFVSLDAALTFIPAVVFSIAALDANANHDKSRARRALTLVEDRIFILTGEPALCHESRSFIKCRNRMGKQWRGYLALIVIYGLIEGFVSIQLLQPKWGLILWPRTLLFIAVLSAPALLLLYSAYGSYKIFTAPLSTLLLEHIEESKFAEPDGQRLLYNTRVALRTPLINEADPPHKPAGSTPITK